VLFCKDPGFTPSNEVSSLARYRRTLLGLPDKPEDGGAFDLVVVGGGIAGTCAALSAARQGLMVALVQDRPVLGGNGSSEVRVWPRATSGRSRIRTWGKSSTNSCPPGIQARATPRRVDLRGPAENGRRPGRAPDNPHDRVSCRCRGGRRRADPVRGGPAHPHGASRAAAGGLLCRLHGDATVGFLAGADYEYSIEEHQGASNLWNLAVTEGNEPSPFPRCPWALDLTDKPFPGRKASKVSGPAPPGESGRMVLESGFQRDMINDIERIRDQNLRAMYGAWDALKNVDRLYPNHRLNWAAFIAGKRESAGCSAT